MSVAQRPCAIYRQFNVLSISRTCSTRQWLHSICMWGPWNSSSGLRTERASSSRSFLICGEWGANRTACFDGKL